MDRDQQAQRLEEDLRLLEEARTREASAERRTQIVGWIVAAAVVVIISGFGYANYRYFEEEWAEEKLAASLGKELDALNELATAELQELGTKLLPVYAEEGRRQFEALAPEISSVLADQIESFGTDVQSDARAMLFDVEGRIRERAANSMLAHFPSLADPRQEAALHEELRRTTERAVTNAITDFDTRFGHDTEELAIVITGFDLSESDEPTVELQKRFVRSWLHLLDEEIEKL